MNDSCEILIQKRYKCTDLKLKNCEPRLELEEEEGILEVEFTFWEAPASDGSEISSWFMIRINFAALLTREMASGSSETNI
jgi:hypothetical protein